MKHLIIDDYYLDSLMMVRGRVLNLKYRLGFFLVIGQASCPYCLLHDLFISFLQYLKTDCRGVQG